MKLGEIVHDSIIENKAKTKNYWEQLMLSSNNHSPNSPISPVDPKKESHQYLRKPNDRRSKKQFAASGPKIVETVAKKMERDKTANDIKREIEKEILMQKEREAMVAQQRDKAFQKMNSAHSDTGFSIDRNETFNLSIPTTDDGNFSESGSNEDIQYNSSDELRAMGMSPVEININRLSTSPVVHHRTLSMDSTSSSGHSSGSYLHRSSYSLEPCTRKRVVTVRPLDQPEEENLYNSARSEKETPIEKEIRLAKEREEELRRDKRFLPIEVIEVELKSKNVTNGQSSPMPKLTPRVSKVSLDSNDQTPEAIQVMQRVLKNKTFKNLSRSISSPTEKKTDNESLNRNIEKQRPSSTNSLKVWDKYGCDSTLTRVRTAKKEVSSPTVGIFSQNPNKKGLMKRFIASRGKLTPAFSFSDLSIAVNNDIKVSPSASDNLPASQAKRTSVKIINKEETNKMAVGLRPGYVSAEDKIQFELKEMKKREKELKKQRARSFVRSQPNLLDIQDDEEDEEPDDDVLNNQCDFSLRGATSSKLVSSLSNPNLSNQDTDDEKMKTEINKPQIKRSALIDVWENMMPKN